MDDRIVDKPGGYLQRTFNAGRASLSALDSKREADLRRQVKAAVFDEQPTATTTSTTTTKTNSSGKSTPAKLVKRHESKKLKRRTSLPVAQPGAQYITATYTPPAAKPYDTYAPLHYDSFVVKGTRSTPTTNTPYDPYAPFQVASKPTRHLSLAAPQQLDSGSSEQPENMYSYGPTITVKPIHQASTRPVNGLYSIDEQAQDPGSDEVIHIAEHVKPMSSYPMYSGLQTAQAKPISHTPRRILNQPRKLSGGNGGNVSTTTITHANKPVYTVRESARTEMRISTWGHHMNNFPTVGSPGSPHSPRTPRTYQRPELLKKRGLTPDERLEALPGEILELVLEHLKDLHLGPRRNSCATCWMRDAGSVSLASRKWSKYARAALYEDIQLVGSDSPIHKKKFKSQGGRLLLLRRTLRSNKTLAGHVRFLKVPALEMPAKGVLMPKVIEQYDDLVSTLIMACPNLEKLAGPVTRYDHTFKKIFHALSTRSQLRSMDWLVDASPAQYKQRTPKSPTKTNGLLMPDVLQPSEEDAWLDLHANWTELQSLSIHCLPGATLTPTTLLPETLTHLPSLRHLHLCNLPTNAFNDDNLLALPRLSTLTLSHISGITSTGLSTFATRATSLGLETLTLRHTSLTSLATLARMFSNLSSLKTFSLIQAFSPMMPEGDLFSLWMMPYLASTTLEKLHWDITSVGTAGNAADGILAKSIAAGGFSALRTLRVPNDPDGMFQALCRPEERIDLPSDRFRLHDLNRAEDSSPPSSPIGIGFLSKSSTATSLTTSSSSSSVSTMPDGPAAYSNLRSARLAAQARLEAAHSMPQFRINVTGDEGLVDAFDMGGFIGTIGSPIRYHLRPDMGSTDEKGGLVDVRDLTGDGGESLLSSNGRGGEAAREGCSGFWNRVDGVVADKKERERWWHTERGRWTRVEL